MKNYISSQIMYPEPSHSNKGDFDRSATYIVYQKKHQRNSLYMNQRQTTNRRLEDQNSRVAQRLGHRKLRHYEDNILSWGDWLSSVQEGAQCVSSGDRVHFKYTYRAINRREGVQCRPVGDKTGDSPMVL